MVLSMFCRVYRVGQHFTAFTGEQDRKTERIIFPRVILIGFRLHIPPYGLLRRARERTSGNLQKILKYFWGQVF